MLPTLEILLPVFVLILAGYACRRRGLLGPQAASELNRFVVWLALPALLFDTMVHATWSQLAQPGFIAVFALACAGVFGAVLAWRLARGRGLADASIDAIAAAYPNTGYIGFPLCLLAFGPASLAPTTIATLLVVCVLFACAVALIEAGLQSGGPPHRAGLRILGAMARNPLVVAPVAGALASALGLELPAGGESALKLLGGAASPCALASLGLFLAERRPADAAASRSALLLAGAKLVGQPLLAWWLAAHVFGLPGPLTDMAVVLAALPTGTGPFMLAEYYRREAQAASRTILLSTLGSLPSLSLLLMHVRQ